MTVDEFRKAMAEMKYTPAGSELHKAFGLSPPFQTDCDKNAIPFDRIETFHRRNLT